MINFKRYLHNMKMTIGRPMRKSVTDLAEKDPLFQLIANWPRCQLTFVKVSNFQYTFLQSTSLIASTYSIVSLMANHTRISIRLLVITIVTWNILPIKNEKYERITNYF